MATHDEYLKDIFKQVNDSYVLLESLKDKSGDLEIIKRETAKITGLLTVMSNKMNANKQEYVDYQHILPSIRFYLENNDFLREIQTLNLLYSDDPMRLKNLRLTILGALDEKNLIEHIRTVIRS